MKSKGLFILLGTYTLLYVFTTVHAYMAKQAMTASLTNVESNEILAAELMAAHLEYVAQAAAQMELVLGALIGALSATLVTLSGKRKEKIDE